MSLTIGISHSSQQTTISFENDAEFWQLYPAFKRIEEATSIPIDLYENSEFKGAHLEILKEVIQSEIESTRKRHETSWLVKTGTIVHPKKQEVFQTLEKEKFLVILENCLELITFAISNCLLLYVKGD